MVEVDDVPRCQPLISESEIGGVCYHEEKTWLGVHPLSRKGSFDGRLAYSNRGQSRSSNISCDLT